MRRTTTILLTLGAAALAFAVLILFDPFASGGATLSPTAGSRGENPDIPATRFASRKNNTDAAEDDARADSGGSGAGTDASGSDSARSRDLQSRRTGGGSSAAASPMERFRDRIESQILEFDADGDGALSEAEREAMFAARQSEMIERFDTNGDGFMSVDEMLTGRRQAFLDSPMGERIRSRFDEDGDGTLNEAERAAMEERFAERDERRMDRILDRHDEDGDGEMSDRETLAMQDAWMDRQRRFYDSVTERFDQNGDGLLDLDERDDAWATTIDRRARQRFLDRYDSNGDRVINDTDNGRFVDAYENGEPLADVNRDGVVNMDDLMEYRDRAEQVNADAP